MWLMFLLLLAVLFVAVATTRWALHPFLALIAAAFGFGLASGRMAPGEVVEAINAGFGATIGHIGIVIVAGAIIGVFLEKSGGALRLAETALRLTGPRHVPLAMSGVGYIVSIPVFCDSAYVILSPLKKALARRAGASMAACTAALALGLFATHTMVPPTPGPVAAAGILGASLGQVILFALPVSLAAMFAGWLFAILMGPRVHIESPPLDVEAPAEEVAAETSAQTPGFVKSLLPILVPLVLIVLKTVSEAPARPFGEGHFAEFAGFVGHPVVALLIGVVLAAFLPARLERQMFSPRGWVGQAVGAAAVIILITGAGGAFGRVLQESGVAEVVEAHLVSPALGLLLPFLIAAAIKTAQGSSTVAIITTAGILLPLLDALGLAAPEARALAVVAIGAGAIVVSHANDSYFWVVTQLSGMTVKQGFRLQTLGSLVQGLSAFVALWLISKAVL